MQTLSLPNLVLCGFDFRLFDDYFSIMKRYLIFLTFLSCADLTTKGAEVGFVQTEGGMVEIQEVSDRMIAKKNCMFISYIQADTALFPGSYSIHENEIHSALRNRAAKLGANVVIANFYKKPAQGAALKCPESEI